MPFANTGFAAPNNFTNSAGVLQLHERAPRPRTLSGQYVRITDNCGAISAQLGERRPRLCGGAPTDARLHHARLRRRRQHVGLALRLLRDQQDQGAGPRLAARQHLAAGPAHGQREHQPSPATRSGTASTRQLLPLGRRLPEHGRDRGRVRPRVGPRHGRQRHRRRAQQLQRGLRGHRRHLPPAGLLRGLRLLPDRQPGLRDDRRRHRLQHQRSADRRVALRHRLLGRARLRLGRSTTPTTPDTPTGFVCDPCTHGQRPLRPPGALRGRARAPGGLGLRGPRPDRPRPSTWTARRVHRGQQGLLPGQRQHRRLALLHLRRHLRPAAAPPTATCSGSRRTTTTAT